MTAPHCYQYFESSVDSLYWEWLKSRELNQPWCWKFMSSQKSKPQTSLQRHSNSGALWPELAIFCTLGNFLKPWETINLPKSPTFLDNFCKGVKIFNFLVKSFLGNFYRHLEIFFLSHCSVGKLADHLTTTWPPLDHHLTTTWPPLVHGPTLYNFLDAEHSYAFYLETHNHWLTTKGKVFRSKILHQQLVSYLKCRIDE